MEIALILLSILLGSGLGCITFLLFWEYMEYDEIDKRLVYAAIALLLLIGALFYVLIKHAEDLYDTVRCTEYHVTEQISDKGDTTYVIKYKPS